MPNYVDMSSFKILHRSISSSAKVQARGYGDLVSALLWKLRHPNDAFVKEHHTRVVDSIWYQSTDKHLAPIFVVDPPRHHHSSVLFVGGPYFHPLIYLLNAEGYLANLLSNGYRVYLMAHRGHDLSKGNYCADMEHIAHYDIPAAADAIRRYDSSNLMLIGADIGSVIAMGWLSIGGTEDFNAAALIDLPYDHPSSAYKSWTAFMPPQLTIPIRTIGALAAQLDLDTTFSALDPSIRRRILNDGLCAAPLRFVQQRLAWDVHPRIFNADLPNIIKNIQVPLGIFQPQHSLHAVQEALGEGPTYNALNVSPSTIAARAWPESERQALSTYLNQYREQISY